MRQTLFYIPNEIPGFPVPVFFFPSSDGTGTPLGFGLLFIVWALASGGLFFWLVRRQGWTADTKAHLPMLGLFGAAILFLLPRMLDAQGRLPVRGFGVALLVSVGAATFLAMHQARKARVDPDIMLSLMIWLFVPGILGGRLFYILQYWSDFRQLNAAGGIDWTATARQLANVAQGGLVVYGAVLGCFLGLVAFVRANRIPILVLSDLVAPSLALAQGLGRVGCFLNGCCYGGLCTLPWAMSFPADSPPYARQLQEGQFYGLRIGDTHEQPGVPVVLDVRPGLPGAEAGLKPGDRIVAVNGAEVNDLDDARLAVANATAMNGVLNLQTADGSIAMLRLPAPPRETLPIHPTQLYSTIDGLVICVFLLAVYPYRRRDGETTAWLLTLYPTTRFLMEIVRTDEAGQFGTGLTISQLISLGVLACAAALWLYLRTRPKGSLLDSTTRPAAWTWSMRTA
jgi:phosphatidylglycerol:prolipoprotein diacylglycerol transferase